MTDEFSRSELLLGQQGVERLGRARVILFGVGGVGSWCAEALVRTGLTHLTLVDFDTVAPSNINRQLPATSSTVGLPKVEAMRRRLLDINPEADIRGVNACFTADSAADFSLGDYHYVIDAIDSVAHKAALIVAATSTPGLTLFSSMGAARKLDPLQMRVDEFWQAKGCPLAAALRHRFKRTGVYPRRKFKVVYSPEIRPNQGGEPGGPNGSLAQVTGCWGLTLCSLVVNHLLQRPTLD